MKLDRFIAERTDAWNELAGLIRSARRKPERLGPRRVRRLGELYRSAAADLAYVRRRWPDEAVVPGLQSLVTASHSLVYDSVPRSYSARAFLATGYWRRVHGEWRLLVLSAVLLALSTVLGGFWAVSDPETASRFVGGQLQDVAESLKLERDLGLSGAQQAAFSATIMTNNIQVSFLAFASGILVGLGPAYVLLFNGAVIGVVAGLALQAGNGPAFLSLVSAHGILELSCIVVAGATGLRLGWSVVSPGTRRRSSALVEEARGAVEVVLGTIPWFVLAAVIEGFVTPTGLGVPDAIGVGLLAAAVYWSLVFTRGRPISQSESDSRFRA